MQLIVPKDIEQWLDNTREHRSRAAQIIKLLYDAQEHDTYDTRDDHTHSHPHPQLKPSRFTCVARDTP
jgi:hypothetical protein